MTMLGGITADEPCTLYHAEPQRPDWLRFSFALPIHGFCPVFPKFPCKFEVERKQPLARAGNQSANAPMKIGYARVSTGDQNPELQITALKREGCERIAGVLRHPHNLRMAL